MAEGGIDSIGYCNRNAGRFAADTAGRDMSVLHERFLRNPPVGGRVLDAGRGVGRDALTFVQRGCSVVAFDAPSAMVRLATERVASLADVLRMSFEEAHWRGEFDGIWASASLPHLRAPDLPSSLWRLRRALRSGGALYMSFKYGCGERVMEGRRFTDQTEQSLPFALNGTGLALREVWVTDDVRAGRPESAGSPP